MVNVFKRKKYIARALLVLIIPCFIICGMTALAAKGDTKSSNATDTNAGSEKTGSASEFGGGYALSGQLKDVSYTTEVYDASNGLPTSDAMYILGATDGHIWLGGYSGVIKYDGSVFERRDTSNGLTSARAIFEDKKGRIWVGTNDNGVVLIDGMDEKHYTYKEGLTSSCIRTFAEDGNGNVFIGTTAGVCYVDSNLNLHELKSELLNEETIIRLDSDSAGRIYGLTKSGIIFTIDVENVTFSYKSKEVGMDKATALSVDPNSPGKVYIGNDKGMIFHGYVNDTAGMERMSAAPVDKVYWVDYKCNRLFVMSNNILGYFDVDGSFKVVNDMPINSGLEMFTTDYQGNIWIASSSQGVVKVVTNNFVDVTKNLGLPDEVTNATLLDGNLLYIGTDNGLRIADINGGIIDNALTQFIGDTRLRCIKKDSAGNIWIATYENDKGLICYGPDGSITSFTKENGLPDNEVRGIDFASDGSVLAGTNGGLAVINGGNVVRTVGSAEGIKNTVFLTICEAQDGNILAGSDGDGLYIIGSDGVKRLGRADGLTSDVILRIVKDEKRGIEWLITSNSIEYIKDGKITEIKSFPYNNNYDMYFDDSNNLWILSSYGIYTVNADEMYKDDITSYRLYTIDNGLPYAVTSNSYSCRTDTGDLYIPGRDGTIRVNINNYYVANEEIKTAIRSVVCDDKKIAPEDDGSYTIPASEGRVQIAVSVMDYTMLNPTVRIFMEGQEQDGITVTKSDAAILEYTNMKYGSYTLHAQMLDNGSSTVVSDDTFSITKTPTMWELPIVKVLVVLILVVLAGFIVWRFMKSTVIRRQYTEIKEAKDEAERASSAKTRFLANMSHEIRTPINTIMGMNEMALREDFTGVSKEEYHNTMVGYSFDIRNAARSLLSLINDLLDMSKIESGKMHLVEQEYDSANVIRSIVSMIRPGTTEKELTFDVVVDEMLPRRLYGDYGKIKQIIINLLSNALKYTNEGGFCFTVDMTKREGDVAYLRFSVNDTGIGVKEEDSEKLFTAYERLDEEKNSDIQGTGLGLDISKKFSELLGGELIYESDYGKGTEFILTLKQKIVDAKPLGAFIEDEDEKKGKYIPKFIAPDADILVVDDNPMNLNVIKGLLAPTRVFVTTSPSGKDALDKISVNKFDVVLLDHMMPGMDGIETLERIRKDNPDLPVYALTANSTNGEEYYTSRGFNGYLSKPVETEILEKTIMSHLPKEKMLIPDKDEAVDKTEEMPEDMMWLYDVHNLDVEEGIKNSGGVANYIYSINMFYDAIDENSAVLKTALEGDNIRLYTIKVHALKSNARIIGAGELSKKAEKLEEAGNKEDVSFIKDNHSELAAQLLSYKDSLKMLKKEYSGSGEELTPEKKEEYVTTLKDAIASMDIDTVENVLLEINKYKLEDDDKKRFGELEKHVKAFDFDKMEEWIKEK